MTKEQVIEKIKKLLALANDNCNDNEAQAALLMAQKLMAKHNVHVEVSDMEETVAYAQEECVHRYDAAGNRLSTDYYTRKLNIPVPLGRVFSAADSINKYHLTREAFLDNCVYTANNRDFFGIEFVHNPEGYIRYNNMNEHYHFYYIKDHLGNICI